MARELSLVLGHKSPLWKLFSLSALNKEPANLVAAEFKPEHVVSQIQV
jgi:hypothetical protein